MSLSSEFFENAPPGIEEWFDLVRDAIVADLGESPEAWRGSAITVHAVCEVIGMFLDHPDAALAALAGVFSKLTDLPLWPENIRSPQ